MDFQSKKSFEKLRLRAFQILCILKHVGDRSSTPKGCNAIYVGDHNKSSIYIGFYGMAENP